MEQAEVWTLLDEIEDDGPISALSAQRVRANAPAGCLICALEEGDDE
jgi:hypothetical protein